MIRVFKKLFGKKKDPHDNYQPEASVIVTFDSEVIRCEKPNSPEESIAWNKLAAVLIETTDTGPMSPDVFWLLLSKDMQSGCIFPQGATGDQELLSEMQTRLPGFSNEMLIAAMTSSDNQRFLLWEKEE